MGNPRHAPDPRHALVLTSASSSSSSSSSNKGVWFLGHGSFNSLTDLKPNHQYTIPVWLTGGVTFWCPDGEGLQDTLANLAVGQDPHADLDALVRQIYPGKDIPKIVAPGHTVPMYRLTNADDRPMTKRIKDRYRHVITVNLSKDGEFRAWSKTIKELIEHKANRALIEANDYAVHWLACRLHKRR